MKNLNLVVLYCFFCVATSESFAQVKTPAEGRSEMEKDVQFHQERFRNWEGAFVLYGQINLPRGVKENMVVTPASIHKGGYFSIVCFSKDAKVPFLLHGYHPVAIGVDGITHPEEELVHTPEPQYVTERVGAFEEMTTGRVRTASEKAPAFNVGLVQLKPLTVREGVRVYGEINMIAVGGAVKKAIQASVEFRPVYGPSRKFFPNPLRVGGNEPPSLSAQIGKERKFAVVLNPCIYHVRLTAQNAQPKGLYLPLTDINELNLGKITLEERRIITNSINMELVNIPSGHLMEGGNVDHTFYASSEENRHGEYVWPRYVNFPDTFYCGVTEVTMPQFQCVMRGRPVPSLNAKSMPQWGVTYEMAEEFCEKLSAMDSEISEGRSYRLPTEAEWEYIIKGAYHSYPLPKPPSREFYDLGNFAGGRDLGRKLFPVKSYDPSPYGVYDLIGNVSEFTSDKFWPLEPDLGVALKGGSFTSTLEACFYARSPSGAETNFRRGGGGRSFPFSGGRIGFRVICEIYKN